MREQVTPLLITYNEAPNLARILAKLEWAGRIVVIDSGSTDATLDILRACPKVCVIFRSFTDFASQCNFGLKQVTSPWVLSLDADYELSDELIESMEASIMDDSMAGFRARFVYRIYGHPLRASLYPPRVVLYRKDLARYQNEGHGHRVIINGEVGKLHGVIYHDDRKPLSRWLASQLRYAREEADHLLGSPRQDLSRIDRLRLMGWPAPPLVVVYTLLVKGCLFDGWPGWYYVLQRLCAEVLVALEITDRRLGMTAVADQAAGAPQGVPRVAAVRPELALRARPK
jgi:glycosyltransferase involved in cell wall biosynthesis